MDWLIWGLETAFFPPILTWSIQAGRCWRPSSISPPSMWAIDHILRWPGQMTMRSILDTESKSDWSPLVQIHCTTEISQKWMWSYAVFIIVHTPMQRLCILMLISMHSRWWVSAHFTFTISFFFMWRRTHFRSINNTLECMFKYKCVCNTTHKKKERAYGASSKWFSSHDFFIFSDINVSWLNLLQPKESSSLGGLFSLFVFFIFYFLKYFFLLF